MWTSIFLLSNIWSNAECPYILDDTILATTILKKGDASFTLYGGHTFKVLQEDTIIYEYKTGPYEGQQLDKVLIW